MRSHLSLFSALAAFGLAAAPAAQAASPGDYIALGDSYAYGFTTTANLVSAVQTLNTASLTGYQGYVQPFAQFLGIPEANVFNLALPGETTSSFLNGGNGALPINLNYAADPAKPTSQAALLSDTLNSLKLSGGNVKDITVQLGGNDLLDQALLGATPNLTTFQANYLSILQTLKTQAPNASIFAIGYFDPFTPLGINDPFHGLGQTLLPLLNGVIQTDATLAGVKYVPLATAFAGREEQLSYDTQPLNQSQLKAIDPTYTPDLPDAFPDYHPNAAGYQVIAGQLDQAALPEPGAWALLGMGLPLVAFVARRRSMMEERPKRSTGE